MRPAASTGAVATDRGHVVPVSGGLEVLLLRRNAALRFMGGMYVFPGGAVHAGDGSERLAERVREPAIAWPGSAGPSECRAYALAAIRETWEESGLSLGLVNATAGSSERVRAQLLQGEDFAAALEQNALQLDLRVLMPLVRWITPQSQAIRFDTRFYAALAPADQTASPDRCESDDVVWRSPELAICEHGRGELPLSPPTLATLQELVGLGSAAELFAWAESRPAPTIEPVMREENGKKLILYPGDLEHPVRERALRGPTRRWM